MSLYLGTDTAGTNSFSLQDFEPSFQDKLSASTREAWLESYGPVATDWWNARQAGKNEQKLTLDQSAAIIKESGLKLTAGAASREYTKSQLDILLERQRELTAAKDVRDRTPWDLGSVVRGGAMFGAGILDPINLATVFVPWTKSVSALNAVRVAASAGESLAARTAARAVLGGADAGISTAALEPAYSSMRDTLGDDYTAMDSMANIAFGTAFGGGLHSIGGAAGDAFRALRRRGADVVPTPEALATASDMTPEQRVEAGIAPEAARAGMPEIVEPRATVEVDAPQNRVRDMPRSVRDDIGTAIYTRDAYGSGSPFMDAWESAGRNIDDFTERNILDAIDKNYGESLNVQRMSPMEINNEGRLVSEPIVEQYRAMLADSEAPPILIARDADGNARVVEGGHRLRAAQDAGAQEVTVVDVTDLLSRTPEELFAVRPDTAADSIQKVGPETREAGLRASVAQSVDGRNVDVDAIIGMDEAVGRTTIEDVKAAADRSFEPEQQQAADFEASAEVEARVKVEGRKSYALDDANTALSDADAALADTLKAGDEAYKYSREAASRGATLEEAPVKLEYINQSLKDSFGNSTQALLDAGKVKVVSTIADLPGGPHPDDVKAVTMPDGSVYVVAQRVTAAEARGLVLHEVGVHVGMENMLGPETFGAVLKQLDDAVLRGESWAQAARNAVPADTPAHLVREEQLAYLVQNSPELPLVKRIIAAIKAWVFKNFTSVQGAMKLTEADYQALAVSALHAVARGDVEVRARRRGAMYSEDAGQTDTKQFRDWFGKSKVVDADGKPLVVYHGTKAEISQFREDLLGSNTNAPSAGEGFFFTENRSVASGYASERADPSIEEIKSPLGKAIYYRIQLMNERIAETDDDVEYQRLADEVDRLWREIDAVETAGANVVPVYLSIKKPFEYDFAGEDRREVSYFDLIRKAKAEGHDGVILRNTFDRMREDDDVSPHDVFVAFDPTQIKSATGNSGSFDPNNPDIRYARGETPDTSAAADELKPYDEAVARAKQFAAVLRAAADKLNNDAQAAEAMRAAMPDISAVEIKDLLDQLRKQVKGLRSVARSTRDALGAEDVAAGLQDEAMQAADELANNLELAAVIEKRNAALNLNARLKGASFVNQFRAAGLDVEGFRGLLVGTERKRVGGRISVDAEQKNFRGKWIGGMLADVEKAGLREAFVSGAFDRDTYTALWNLGRDVADNSKLPTEAVKLAEIINKYQTDARATRNRFGAWIRDLQGYIVRQSHDMYKIRGAGEKAWIETVLPLLDIPKMQKLNIIGKNVEAALRGMYDDFAAGSHMKPVASEVDTVALGRGSNLAKRESQSRTLFFKDGDAAFQYNEKFGEGRLADAVLSGLDHSAKSAGLLKILGTNPEANLQRMFDEYADSLRSDPARRAKFLSSRKEVMTNLLGQVDGTVNIPGNVNAAKIGAFLRAWQSMSKLGGALISSVTDLTNYAAELRFGQDKNLLSGTLDGIGALTQGRAKGDKAAILNSLGVFHESTLGAVFNRFDSPELVGGKTAWAMQQFFKLNGLTWWTEALKDGYALQHSNYLASNSGKAFDKLDPALRDMLGLYNIDAGKWDILRIATMQEADGRKYMTPEGLKTVPTAVLENYIKQAGRTISDASILNLQEDIASALRTMTIDRTHHAVIEPNARARAFMLRGTQPGTVPGEVLRYIGQFKSFPVAMIQMTLGREVYGRGYDTIGDYLKNGKGDMLGLATFIGLSTMMGYAAMSAKDLLRGKNPRPVDDPRTWAAAMVQGGGLGIYGDFLFNKYNRMGGTLSGSMGGPVLNTVDTAADLWTRIRTGDDFAAVGFNAALQNTPFMNLFYTRAALDYLVIYRMQEAMNPGFLRRMERRAERENGQTYYLPPSQVAR